MAWRAVAVFCFLASAAAFPNRLSNFNCRAWAPGESGYMNSGPLVDGAALNSGSPNCEVSVTGDLMASHEYTVTVMAAVNSLMKLFSSDGTCLNPDEAHSSASNRAGSMTFTWTAPASIDSEGIMFHAICSSGFSAAMYAAAPKQLCPSGGCLEQTSSTEAEEEAKASTTAGSQVATVSDFQLAEGMFLSFRPATTAEMEEGLEITVTFNDEVWIGFGFSTGNEVSMSGNGEGAEIYVCTDGEVRRHFVTIKSISGAGDAVAESSCSQENGAASMTFKRSLAVNGRRLAGHAVTPGSTQQVIWASASSNQKAIAYHNDMRGGLFIDFATGDVQGATDVPSTTAGSSTESSVATVADFELTAGMLLSFNPANTAENEEGIEITVTFDDDVWIGFGFSAGSGVSMTGSGNGADIYVCSNGEVRRHFVRSRSISGSGEEVPESSCTQENGAASMTFTRSLDSSGRRLEGRAVTPGSQQQVIWGYATGGQKGLGYHGSNRGGVFIDFATGNAGEAFLEGQAPLYIHIVLMILAWGFFLPSGVALAKCLRRAPNGTSGGVWFSLHWKFQAVGFVLTLLGLAAAIWYAEEYSTHLDQNHSVVGVVVCCLAVLQVFGGALRPHKADPPSAARVAFEYGHKGLGYLALLLGALNIILGIALVYDLEFESAVKSMALALTVIFVLPVLIFVAVSAVMPENPLSKLLLGKPTDLNGEEAPRSRSFTGQATDLNGEETGTTIGNSAQ